VFAASPQQLGQDRSIYTSPKTISRVATATPATHWLPVCHRIDYKLAVSTYNVRSTTAPAQCYFSRHIKSRESAWTLRSSGVPLLDIIVLLAGVCRRRLSSSVTLPLLDKPCTRTEFAKCGFDTRHSAPSVWNSLPVSNITSDSRPVFKYLNLG